MIATGVFAIPPVAEQRAIAAFLDRETARIDALVAKKERLIELLQEQRTALITRAVTKGLDPNVPMKDSGVEWLGEIPAHWEVKALSASLVGSTYGVSEALIDCMPRRGITCCTEVDIERRCDPWTHANYRARHSEQLHHGRGCKPATRRRRRGTRGRVMPSSGTSWMCMRPVGSLLSASIRGVDVGLMHRLLRASCRPKSSMTLEPVDGTAHKARSHQSISQDVHSLPPMAEHAPSPPSSTARPRGSTRSSPRSATPSTA